GKVVQRDRDIPFLTAAGGQARQRGGGAGARNLDSAHVLPETLLRPVEWPTERTLQPGDGRPPKTNSRDASGRRSIRIGSLDGRRSTPAPPRRSSVSGWAPCLALSTSAGTKRPFR